MYQELFGKSTAQLEDLIAPARKFQGLVVDHFTKLADFQLDALRAYTDLGLEQLRAVKNVGDAKSFQDYVSSQSKVAKTVGDKVTKDVNTLAALNKDFTAEVQKLAQENVAKFGQAAKPAAPKAAAAKPAAPKPAAPKAAATPAEKPAAASKPASTKAASASKSATTTKTPRKSSPRKSA